MNWIELNAPLMKELNIDLLSYSLVFAIYKRQLILRPLTAKYKGLETLFGVSTSTISLRMRQLLKRGIIKIEVLKSKKVLSLSDYTMYLFQNTYQDHKEEIKMMEYDSLFRG